MHSRADGVARRGRVRDEGAVTSTAVAVHVTLDDRRERQPRLAAREHRHCADLPGVEARREDHHVPRIIGPGRPFALARVTETGAVEATELALRRLHRVVERREERDLRPELEHVRREPERELAAITLKVADARRDAAELRGHARLGSRHRAAVGVDRARRDEHWAIPFARQRELLGAGKVGVDDSRLREVV